MKVSEDSTKVEAAHFLHVHVCVHCSHVRRREEIDSREVGSGILHCQKCNLDGPLNVEIQESFKLAASINSV